MKNQGLERIQGVVGSREFDGGMADRYIGGRESNRGRADNIGGREFNRGRSDRYIGSREFNRGPADRYIGRREFGRGGRAHTDI